MGKTVILIPPSEGKSSGGDQSSLKRISKDVLPILEKLTSVNSAQWEKLLGVKGKALKAAIAANTSILSSPTMPAIERYTGVVYNAIEYPTLASAAKKHFDQNIRIVSALFGLVKPQDLIPDYKLKIDKLGADEHWQSINDKALKGYFVIDLLPQAHKKAVSYDNGIFVDFLILKDGKRKPAGHKGKHIKGRFIRWLCDQPILTPKIFSKFKEDGFKWQDGVFVKIY